MTTNATKRKFTSMSRVCIEDTELSKEPSSSLGLASILHSKNLRKLRTIFQS